jgi:uncharacterized protein YqhQ
MSRGRTPASPAACSPEHTFGGQAVIEGVMMRGRHSWGVAIRRPSGGIARAAYPLDPPGSSHSVLRWPIVRGVVALWDSLSLGVKALGISANIGTGDPEAPEGAADGTIAAGASGGEDTVFVDTGAEVSDADLAAVARESFSVTSIGAADTPAAAEPPGETAKAPVTESTAFGFKELAVTVVVSLALAVGLFVVIPLVVVKSFEDTFSNPFVFNLVEGVIRIAIFILYIVGISLIPDLRRVFQYHGAEHKVIHAYEHCGRPDAEEARQYPTLHPRCGTGFLFVVMVIAILLFAVVGKPSLPWLVLSRIIGIPVIVGISYEVGIKWAGKHPNGPLARVLLWPGLQLQRLTTREPTEDQLEVAAAALEEVMAMDASRRSVEETAPVPA